MKKNKLKKDNNRTVFVLGTIFWLGIIFLFSAEPNLQSPFSHNTDLILRKTAHIAEYFILTFLLWKALLPRVRSNLLLVVFLLALSGAVLDECHQMFVAGREGTLRDVLFDMVGILSAIYFIIRKSKNEKGKKHHA